MKYPMSKEIQIQLNGMKALWNLSLDIKANAEFFVTEFIGIVFISNAMSLFPNDAEVVHWSCMVLLRVSQSKNLRQLMKNASVVSALATTIDGHKGIEDTQEVAHKATKLLM